MINVYNEEDELVANDMETIAELLEGLGYKMNWTAAYRENDDNS